MFDLKSHIFTNESQPFKRPNLPNQRSANLFNLTSPINKTHPNVAHIVLPYKAIAGSIEQKMAWNPTVKYCNKAA